MQQRKLGRTGLATSVLSFGCGAVGGLMTKGDPADQERAVARALDMGINYFDTASIYGSGTSEQNLGRVWARLMPKAAVGTKFRLKDPDYARIGAAVRTSLEESLKRLGLPSVDLLQLHNRIGTATGGDVISPSHVLGEVVPALQKARQDGLIRHFGITALGETGPLNEVVSSGAFDTAQVCYNALNPTSGASLGSGYPAQDYAGLLGAAGKAGMGTIGIRILAGGALSGSELAQRLLGDFVDRVLGGAVTPLVAYLNHSQGLKADEVAQLKRLVAELERQQREDKPCRF